MISAWQSLETWAREWLLEPRLLRTVSGFDARLTNPYPSTIISSDLLTSAEMDSHLTWRLADFTRCVAQEGLEDLSLDVKQHSRIRDSELRWACWGATALTEAESGSEPPEPSQPSSLNNIPRHDSFSGRPRANRGWMRRTLSLYEAGRQYGLAHQTLPAHVTSGGSLWPGYR